MKKSLIITSVVLVFLLGFSIFLSGCSCSNVIGHFFDKIKDEPEKYNGQNVTFTGFWFDGFEIAVVAESLTPQPFWPGNYQPSGSLIWVQGGLPDEVSTKLYLQPNNPTGYPAHYGEVEVTGLFEYGGKYGHMDAYKYQIQIQGARWLDWTPPQ